RRSAADARRRLRRAGSERGPGLAGTGPGDGHRRGGRNRAAPGKGQGMLTTAECVHLACVFEATARKPGNVHRFRDFDDLTYLDFVLSAAAIAPILEHAPARGVGPVVRDAI